MHVLLGLEAINTYKTGRTAGFGVRSQFRCAAPAGRAKGVANLGSDLQNARSRIPNPVSFFSVRAEPVEALCSNQPPSSLLNPDAALSPRRATHFLLLRQEKVSKEKATLVPASLRCATGNLRCSVQPGSRSNSPAAQTIAGPDPSGPALLGAFTRVLGSGIRESEAVELTAL